jgi:23S rRNA (uridine2552-2'-O)-methyltransferase
MHVLDVGAAPGSFIQVISRIVDLDHKVVGIDVTKIDPNFGRTNIHLLKESIFEYEKVRIFLDSLGVGQFDLITSDIAPSTTGMT